MGAKASIVSVDQKIVVDTEGPDGLIDGVNEEK